MTIRLPSLSKSLQAQDLGYLRIVAELWGLELDTSDPRGAAESLAATLLDPELLDEMIALLPAKARAALDELLGNQGYQPWAQFTRKFGAVREMGAGRRDRQQPHRQPESAAEVLWYRALLARAFFDTPSGPEEFAYLPADLIPLFSHPDEKTALPLGRPASPGECAHRLPASDRILDEACTLLAALRTHLPSLPGRVSAASTERQPNIAGRSGESLQSLLAAAGLLDPAGFPQPEATRLFLEAGRGEALAQLAHAWLHSDTFNELRLMPGLRIEGEWENDPLHTRQTILGFLSGLPKDTWWSLNAFVAAIKQHAPDFQRPAGNYDSWFIRRQESEEYLRGFDHWDEVDGALIRYLITGPLHWLGISDLAAPGPADPPTAFRPSAWSAALLDGLAPEGLPPEEEPLLVTSDARVRVPRLAPRAARYQIARCSAWEGEDERFYHYRLTPVSLENARQQGLRMSHLLAVLRRHASAVPPTLVKAMERWEEHGTEAHLEKLLVLRLSSPGLLQELRASRAARFLGDPLGPTAVIVKPGAWEKVLSILAELGYLGEVGPL